MISYAQSGEDVALAKLFPDGYVGRYLDIGAHHPTRSNNTYLFYTKGWTGVCVEPTPSNHALLKQYRPDDVCLCLAVADYDGEATFYECVETSVSTLDDGEANKRAAAGHPVTPRTVPVRTVATLVREIPRLDPAPDIMSVDVEGAERAVLEGCPFAEGWRPRALVIEATYPCTAIPCHDLWEHILTAHGYRHRDTRGVNRIYTTG